MSVRPSFRSFLVGFGVVSLAVCSYAGPLSASQQGTPPGQQIPPPQQQAPPTQQTPPPDPVQEPPPSTPPVQTGPMVPRAQAANARRPVRRLFGESAATQARRHSLTVRGTLNLAYDSNLLAEGGPGVAADPRLQVSGTYMLLNPEADYAYRGRRVTFDTTFGSALRYYPDPGELTALSTWLNTSLTAAFGRNTSLGLSAGGLFQPYSGIAPFPGLARLLAAADFYSGSTDFLQTRNPAFSYNAAIDLTRQVGRQSTMSFGYALRRTDYDDPAMRDLHDRGAYVRFARRLTRNVGVRLGYGYREGTLGGLFIAGPSSELGSIRSHDIDAGVDFNRALGRTRRTTVGFTTGTSVLNTPVQNLYRLLASGYLSHQFGRSGTLRVDYQRGLQLVEGLNVPLFTDAVTVTARAMAGPRWDFSASAGYTTGEFGTGLMTGEGGFDTYTGTARAQFGLSRHLALQAEYFFYHYLFPPGTSLVPGFARGLDRQGVRGGITFWTPVNR